MNLKKKIEKLWIVNKTIELLDRAFTYDQHLGCLLTALVFLTALPVILALLPILWMVVLLKK